MQKVITTLLVGIWMGLCWKIAYFSTYISHKISFLRLRLRAQEGLRYYCCCSKTGHSLLSIRIGMVDKLWNLKGSRKQVRYWSGKSRITMYQAVNSEDIRWLALESHFYFNAFFACFDIFTIKMHLSFIRKRPISFFFLNNGAWKIMRP